MRLNLGCGRDIRPGWVNIDTHLAPGVDLAVDLDNEPHLPYPDSSVEHIEGSHVIEHLRNPLPMMQELWRVAAPDALCVFRCPYGSSDDADNDPTHVRRLFAGSWIFFGQGAYWRADYGYRGDWQPVQVDLHVYQAFWPLTDAELAARVDMQRNVVREMVATLRAVKPARPAVRASQEPFDVVIVRR